MRVNYQRWSEGNQEMLKVVYTNCCDTAFEAKAAELIGFGNINEDGKPDDAIYLYQRTSDSDQYALWKINFCPFCGTRIEIEPVDFGLTAQD